MADRKNKTVVKAPRGAVPLWVWIAAAMLFAGVVLFAHQLPDPSRAEALAYFNVKRVERFAGQQGGHPLRVVVLGISHAQCALFFDEEMEAFSRTNGFGEIQFLRFAKLDGAIADFVPVLGPISEARPDIVLIEANLLLFDFRGGMDDMPQRFRFLRSEELRDRGDDRNKLRNYFLGMLGIQQRPRQAAGPNDAASDRKAYLNIRHRQSELDFSRYRDAGADRLRVRSFGAPTAFIDFFESMKRTGVPVVMLDVPRSAKANAIRSDDINAAAQRLIRQYQDACGLRYLAYPGPLGTEYFKDFVHMNEQGRERYSRWFLSELPRVLERRDGS